jgi:hypothetical protein
MANRSFKSSPRYKPGMATARDIAAKINAAAVYLTDSGHYEVADALQLVLAGADDFAACMGAAPG